MIVSELIAVILRDLNVRNIYGVVGIPIIKLAETIQNNGIQFVGFRNEQAASYAAGVEGYINAAPGVLLTVAGPGLIHSLAGIANASVNNWPLVVISAGYDIGYQGRGTFQELNQLDSIKPFVKFSARIEAIHEIEHIFQKCFQHAVVGRPGVCYVELPGNIIYQEIDFRYSPVVLAPCPISVAPIETIQQSIDIILAAKKPLAIIGKGAAYARAENEIQQIVEKLNIPFISTPMGRGVISDLHPNCVSSARSKSISSADCVILFGCRLNWILQFGKKFSSQASIIQFDICPEEYFQNVQVHKAIQGHIKSNCEAMLNILSNKSRPGATPEWWSLLKDICLKNSMSIQKLCNEKCKEMTYYTCYNEIIKHLPEDCVYVSEGANTMDVGRTMLLNKYPRQRFDAGTFATMGVGLGYAIAAKLNYPDSQVVCIQGDSSFGFSGLELETAMRFKLDILFIIFNNNGIYRGLDLNSWNSININEKGIYNIPPTSFIPSCHYEKIVEAFGGKGVFVENVQELADAIKDYLKDPSLTLINCMINPQGLKKEVVSLTITCVNSPGVFMVEYQQTLKLNKSN